jgi:hypothetical protein
MMTDQQLADCVLEIHRLTGKSNDEIHEFIKGHEIKYSDLRNYARACGYFPDQKECKFIGKYGIDHLLNAKGIPA